MLTVGTLAPSFSLPDSAGQMMSLAAFRGKKVVVYFYPKDNTAGCTRQANAFRDAHADLLARGVVVIGISKDSQESHQRFAEKYQLPFVLLSDPELQAIQAYGVWQEKKLYGKVSFGVLRSTFVIDEAGKIIAVFPKAKPDSNATEVVAFLDQYFPAE